MANSPFTEGHFMLIVIKRRQKFIADMARTRFAERPLHRDGVYGFLGSTAAVVDGLRVYKKRE